MSVLALLLATQAHGGVEVTLIRKVHPLPGVRGDRLGNQVAVGNGHYVAGANRDDRRGHDAGAVYLYHRYWWAHPVRVVPGLRAEEWFGDTLALGPTVLAVGCWRCDTYGANAGLVRLMRHTDGWWQPEVELTPSGVLPQDLAALGIDLDDTGDTLFLGSPGRDGAARDTGRVTVFTHQGGAWAEVDTLEPDGLVEADGFGRYIAIRGDLAVVGAAGNAGSAWVFRREADMWGEVGTLRADDGADGDSFGRVVATNGSRVVVGAPDHGEGRPGAVYLYDEVGPDSWAFAAKLTSSFDGLDWYYGATVAISDDGELVVVGSRHDDTIGPNNGAVYFFERRPDGSWDEVYKLIAHDADPSDLFGTRVALSGDELAVGARHDSDHVDLGGAAYFYRVRRTP